MSAAAVRRRLMNQVRTVGTVRGSIRCIRRCCYVEWKTRLQHDDAVSLPVRERALYDPVRECKERNVITDRGYHAMSNVPVGVSVIGPPQIWIHRSAPAVGI